MPHVLHVSDQETAGTTFSPVTQVRSNRAHPCFRLLRCEPTSLDRPHPSRIHASQLEPSHCSRHRPPKSSSPAHPRAFFPTRRRRGRGQIFAVTQHLFITLATHSFQNSTVLVSNHLSYSLLFRTRGVFIRFTRAYCTLSLYLFPATAAISSRIVRRASRQRSYPFLYALLLTSPDNASFPLVIPSATIFFFCGGNVTQVPLKITGQLPPSLDTPLW
jgi:hypothetical protein